VLKMKYLLGGLSLALLCACNLPMSNSASALSGEMNTFCFGRHLIDIPVEAEPVIYGDRLGAVKIVAIKGDAAAFHKMVQETLAERNRKDGAEEVSEDESQTEENWLRRYRLIKSVFPPAETKQIIVSRTPEQQSSNTADYLAEAFVKPEGDYFFYLQTELQTYEAEDKEVVDMLVAAYRDLLPAIRYRLDEELPSEPGVCISHGFIADDGDQIRETQGTEAVFILKKHPDVKIQLAILPADSGEYSLLKRQSHATVVESFPERSPETAQTKTSGKIMPRWKWIIRRVRAGALTVNGMAGEESLAYFPSDDIPGLAHKFSWATAGEPENPYKPFIRLDVVTGQETYVLVTDRSGKTEGVTGALGPSSLETEQIQALYEAVVKTIRIRPTGGDAGPIPPGSIIKTGK
jgi:hypothetical protein